MPLKPWIKIYWMFSQRADAWPLMSSVWPTVAICATYVYFVKVLGPRWGLFFVMAHTVPEQKLNVSKKMTTKGTSTIFLSKDHKTTLTFCQVIILLYTSSRLTKSFTLFSTPVSVSTQRVPLVVF